MRKPIPDPSAGADSAALHAVITAMMEGLGRGGLTQMADRLGLGSPSTARKRLLAPSRAFDEPTMRATLLVAASRADDLDDSQKEAYPLIRTAEANGYEIEVRDVNGTPTPFWRAI